MKDCTVDELIGTFEEMEKNEIKANNLKAQAKMLLDDSNKIVDELAKDKEVKASYIKNGYKSWKNKKLGKDENDDDLFTILALVDEALENEKEENN